MNHPTFSRPVLAGLTIAVIGASSPVVRAAVPDPDATKLTAKYGCQGCHSATTKLVGPSYKEIAERYAGDKSAPGTLAHKIKSGGSGVWGPIPMPPASNASDADIAMLIDRILSQQ